ncbi:hypothetical protein Efla_003707 [Eimeria flavescens]
MQQLRRLNFFDRSIVEGSRFIHSAGDFSSTANRSGSLATNSPPCEAVTAEVAEKLRHLLCGDARGVLSRLHCLHRVLSLPTLSAARSVQGVHLSSFLDSRLVAHGHRRDNLPEKPSAKNSSQDGGEAVEDARTRLGVLKYKCYSTTQVDAKGYPVLLREAGLFSKLPEQVVTCSDINKSFTMLAVGTEGAGVCLFRGDLLREKTCRLRLMKDNDEPINSVRFLASPTDDKAHYMVVCSNTSLTCYAVPLKGEPKSTDCCAFMSGLQSAAVAELRRAAIRTASLRFPHSRSTLCRLLAHLSCIMGKAFFAWILNKASHSCTQEKKRSADKFSFFSGNLWALPSDGQCQILSTHKSYIITVTSADDSPDNGFSTAVSADTLQPSFTNSSSKNAHQVLTVYLCYPDLRLIAYSSPMRGVRHVVSAMDTLFIISRGGARENNVLFDLREKSFEDRLSILLRRATLIKRIKTLMSSQFSTA